MDTEITYIPIKDGWLATNTPPEEKARLTKLRHLQILDSNKEEAFDRITELATNCFALPVAAVSLVDENRQWMKSCYGAEPSEAPRAESFCAHAIWQDEPLIISDTLEDDRFRSNPFVTGDKRLRFYAGAPLITTDGLRVGTLCLFDQQPHEFTENNKKVLKALAAIVVNEMELRLARLTAEKENHEKGLYVAYIGHEVRTPLMTIQTALSLIDAKKYDDTDSRHMQLIGQANDIVLETINDFLDATRLETHSIILERAPFKPHALLEQAASMIRIRAGKDVRIHVSADHHKDVLLKGDPTRLRQIIMNFVCNAGKFTEQGDIFVRSSLLADAGSKKRLRIEVQDSGVGMNKAQMDNLFRKYNQGDSSVCRIYGGSGLGLYICKQLSELMNGEVGASSEPGKGSTFWFEASFEMVEAEETTSNNNTTNTPMTSLKILLAEDNRINHEMIKATLEKSGHTVSSAYNGKEALELACAQAFDFIFMDCQMPIMDGFEATSLIRSHQKLKGQQIPIVAVTANAMAGDKQRCLEAGMDDYLAKPATMAMLEQMIRQWLPVSHSR